MRMGNVLNSCWEVSISKEIREILNSGRTCQDGSACETCDLLGSEDLCSLLADTSTAVGPFSPWLHTGFHHPGSLREVVYSLPNGQRTQTIMP